jgi:hypothetical protein
MNFELYRLQSDGPLAQLVEQFPFKEWVAGSNPAGLTIQNEKSKN